VKRARSDRRHRDCRTLLLRIARGLEGDLSASERRALARHLGGCARCDAFSEDLKRTVALCRGLAGSELTPRARSRAQANIRTLLGRKILK
jgi:anti-sigma factor RsiW